MQYAFGKSTIQREVIVVDTPGLSDTRGTESDSQNVTKILEYVQYLPEIHAIVLVVNGSNPRLTTDVVHTFNLLKGSLPDSVTNNTMAVLTMCNALTWYVVVPVCCFLTCCVLLPWWWCLPACYKYVCCSSQSPQQSPC